MWPPFSCISVNCPLGDAMLQQINRLKNFDPTSNQTVFLFGVALFLLVSFGCGGGESQGFQNKSVGGSPAAAPVEAKAEAKKIDDPDPHRKSMEAMRKQMDIQMMPKEKQK